MNTSQTLSTFLRNALDRLGLKFGRATVAGFVSTMGWQIGNALIPLLTFPYLARVLGAHGFGILGIATAITLYAQGVTEWGFYLTATQAIAQARGDRVTINRIIWTAIGAKCLLGLLSAAVVMATSYFIIKSPELRIVLMVSALSIVGSVINVDWALRGVERFSQFATAGLLGKATIVPLTYLLVHRAADIPQAALVTALTTIITSVLALTFAVRCGVLGWPCLSISGIWRQIRSGAYVFLSYAVTSLYTNCLAIVLGVVNTTAQVGFYSGASKIRIATTGMMAPIGMVAYPRLNYLAATNPQACRRASMRLLRIEGAISFVLAATLCLFAPIAVRLLLGSGFHDAIVVLQILAWLVFVAAIRDVLGVMIMLPAGLRAEFTACIAVGATVGIGAAFPFAYYAGAAGIAVAYILAEIVIATGMYFTLVRKLDWFRGGRYG